MGTFAVYCDAQDYLANASANIETASLLGGNTVLSAGAGQGALSLPVSSTTGFPASGTFTAYLLDGLNSERITATVSGGNLSVAAGTAAAHAAGVNVSSAGASGCLADAIIRASRAMENYCRQGPDGGADRALYAVARTERTMGPSLRCAFDPDYTLKLRPWRWPVQSLSAASVQYGADAPLGLNISYAALLTDGKVIAIPFVALNPPPALIAIIGARGLGFIATWTYIAGPCTTDALSSVPDDLRQACYLLVADILAQRQNPYGLSEQQQGKLHRLHRLRGDRWTTMLHERARELLEPYAQPGWLAAP